MFYSSAYSCELGSHVCETAGGGTSRGCTEQRCDYSVSNDPEYCAKPQESMRTSQCLWYWATGTDAQLKARLNVWLPCWVYAPNPQRTTYTHPGKLFPTSKNDRYAWAVALVVVASCILAIMLSLCCCCCCGAFQAEKDGVAAQTAVRPEQHTVCAGVVRVQVSPASARARPASTTEQREPRSTHNATAAGCRAVPKAPGAVPASTSQDPSSVHPQDNGAIEQPPYVPSYTYVTPLPGDSVYGAYTSERASHGEH